jgi:lysophospholipase L1-like esterase
VDSRLKTVAFSLVPVAILLLVLEIAGRLLYPFDPDQRAMTITERDPRVRLPYFDAGPGAKAILWDVNRMERRYVAFLGFLGKPDTTLPTLRTNQLGFRDEPLAPRQPGEVRVLLLGGSTAWGLGASSNDATVRGALQRILNAGGGTNYRVMSGAFLGYTARQEMTVLTEFLDRYDPDVVVSLTGHNDVMTIMHDSGGVLQRWEARTLEEAVAGQIKPMDTLTALRKLGGSLGIWRLVVYLKELSPPPARPSAKVLEYDPERSKRLAGRVAELHRISAEYAARHGKRHVIVMQPDLYSTKKTLTPEEEGTKRRFTTSVRGIDEAYPQYRQDLAASLAALPGVTFVDLRGPFDRVAEPLFIDDCHLVDRGYELIAEAIAGVLR